LSKIVFFSFTVLKDLGRENLLGFGVRISKVIQNLEAYSKRLLGLFYHQFIYFHLRRRGIFKGFLQRILESISTEIFKFKMILTYEVSDVASFFVFGRNDEGKEPNLMGPLEYTSPSHCRRVALSFIHFLFRS
jgi:hypothetical protein